MLSQKSCFYVISLTWIVLSQIVDFSIIFDIIFKNHSFHTDWSYIFRNFQMRTRPNDEEIRFIRRRLLLDDNQSEIPPTSPPAREVSFTFPPTFQDPYTPSEGVSGTSETVTAQDLVPAVMVAVASSVIFCAVLLYAADVRDRFLHQRMIEDRHRRRGERNNKYYDGTSNSSKQIETIASSSGGGGCWVRGAERPTTPGRGRGVHHHHHHPEVPAMMISDGCYDAEDPLGRMLQHHDYDDDQPEYVDEFSISQVSTMTASVVPTFDNSVTKRVDSSDELEESMYVTELSEANRVSLDKDFANLASLVDLSRLHTIQTSDGNADKTLETYDDQGEEVNGLCLTGVEDINYVMNDDDEDDDDEDESGWTSSVGNSDSSSGVSIGTYLKSIHSSKSTASSSGASSHSETSTSSSSNSQELFGVGCLCDTPQKSTSGDTSLDRSPDTPHGYPDDSSPPTRNELSQLDQVCQKKPEVPIQDYMQIIKHVENSSDEDEGPVAQQDYVRDVYFVPVSCSRNIDLGIQLSDAIASDSYPNVSSINKDSPLFDRVFAGDTILAVNNEWAIGCDASRVTSMFWNGDDVEDGGAAVVKLTILSCRADGSDTESDDDDDDDDDMSIVQSFDTGDVDTAIEV